MVDIIQIKCVEKYFIRLYTLCFFTVTAHKRYSTKKDVILYLRNYKYLFYYSILSGVSYFYNSWFTFMSMWLSFYGNLKCFPCSITTFKDTLNLFFLKKKLKLRINIKINIMTHLFIFLEVTFLYHETVLSVKIKTTIPAKQGFRK